ncbi:MAG: hypothetical protein V4723_10030 [Pseudomonadota bacterium]
MATQITKKFLLALGIAVAASVLCSPSVLAAEVKKPAKASKAKAKAKAKPVITQLPDGTVAPITAEDEPDITDTITTDFNCELGNKVTVYHKTSDDKSIAVRWKKRLHRLTRVGTTTGAVRYENPNYGLIWIGIPSKSMLLDSRLNRQLANECMNAEQANPGLQAAAPAPAPVPAKPDLVAPVGKVVVEPAIPPGAAPAPLVLPPAATDIKK